MLTLASAPGTKAMRAGLRYHQLGLKMLNLGYDPHGVHAACRAEIALDTSYDYA
jgi:hypothetical protein